MTGKVPLRSYGPIEWIIIAGILFGIVGLFQGWKLFCYEFGFLVLLVSVLLFMVWSHLTPMSLRQGRTLPPMSRSAHLIGLAAALVVWAAVTVYAVEHNKPDRALRLEHNAVEHQERRRTKRRSRASRAKIATLQSQAEPSADESSACRAGVFRHPRDSG